jgi:hypothetical protein
MKEDVEQTLGEQRQQGKPRRPQQISQGRKTKGAKFKQERKDASAGQEQSINTLKATSSRKKGRIIHCLPRCRTETGAKRKLSWHQDAGTKGTEPCLSGLGS